MSHPAGSRAVVIIPARFASQRLPGKPLADIDGKPMICHVCARAKQARLIEEVIVATDDQRIADAVEADGGRAVMTPPTLQSGTDRIAWVATDLGERRPCGERAGGRAAYSSRYDRPGRSAPARRSVACRRDPGKADDPAEELVNPSLPKVVLDRDGYCLYFSRSPIPFGRDVPQDDWVSHHTFFRHIGLYVFRRDFLLRFAAWEQTPLEQAEKLEQLRILEHGERMKAVITELDSVAVDTPADLERVRTFMRKGA